MVLEWRLRRPGRPKRRPPHFCSMSFWGHVGVIFRTFSHFFAFFSHLFRLLKSLWFFSHFFSVFHRFLDDLGRILEGFWEDFSMIFRTIMENCDFVKNVVFPP